VVFLIRPPVLVLENVITFKKDAQAMHTLRTYAHEFRYSLLINTQDAGKYLPQSRVRCGFLLVRNDFASRDPSTFSTFALSPPDLSRLNPTPPTLLLGGVLHGHPFSSHSQVESWIQTLFEADHVQRIPEEQLSCLCTTYRSNFHLPSPRLGQWILDPNGCRHWIAPRSFARSMGFSESFHLDSDDITAYKQLGNSISPATALLWLHMGLTFVGV
jgi:site-specific DNA-cytosine methylase